jgi:hypothetical protein
VRVRFGAPADSATLELEGEGGSVEARITDALHRRVTALGTGTAQPFQRP